MGLGMALTRFLLGGAVALALTGCGDSERMGGTTILFGTSLLQLVQGLGSQEEPSRVTASDAQINAAETNVLLVTNEKTGSEAGFALESINGDALHWRSTDGIGLVTRGGQLAGTAGYGFDISSSALTAFNPGSTVTRTQYRPRGDTVIRPETFTCRQTVAGVERIAVTGRVFPTQRIDESCTSDEGATVENTYWLDATGTIRKSRQYAGPGIGYLVLEDVHNGLR